MKGQIDNNWTEVDITGFLKDNPKFMKTTVESKFTIDFETYYTGYSTGELWNGWAIPYFKIEEAKRIMEDMNQSGDIEIDFDEVTGTFIVDGEETPAIELSFNGTQIKAYGIGAFGWTWYDAKWNGLNNFNN